MSDSTEAPEKTLEDDSNLDDGDQSNITENDDDPYLEDGQFFDQSYDEQRFTVTGRVLGISIISIHLACASTRILLGFGGENPSSWSLQLSYLSWLTYILFVPGTLILLNRRKAPLSNQDIVLIMPISLMWVMIIAPSVQVIWAILSFSNPITWWNTSFLSLTLTMLLYFRYSLRGSRLLAFDVNWKKTPSVVFLSASVMLLISVLGPIHFNYSGDNTFSMIAIFLISILPTFFSANSRIGDLALLYSSSLALLLVSSLSSSNVSGLDIQTEYFFANSVIQEQYIDFSSNFHYSTVISTQGLVPLLSIWTGISLTLILKVVYPIIFSYCSILLYNSYGRIFNRDVAYYSTLMTIFGVSFYTSMLDVVRQGFAEIFLLSAIFIMCSSDDIRMHRNRVFLVPFLVSMTLAHYGINYVLYPVFWWAYFIFLGLRLLIPYDFEDQLELLYSTEANATIDEQGEELPVFSLSEDVLLDEEGLVSLDELQNMARDINPLLNLYHLVTGTVFLIAWHSFAGQGSVIQSVNGYLIGIYNRYEMFGIMGAFSRAQPTQFVVAELEPFHEITKYMYIVIMLLSLPSIYFSLREKPKRPSRNFICLALGSWIFFAVVFLVPNISIRLNFPRVYHLLAIFVCPYSFKTISELSELLGDLRVRISPDVVSLLPKVTLCSLLLLSSGFIYQLTDEGHRAYLDSEMDYAIFSDSEEAGSIWEENFGQEELGFECRASDYFRSKLLGKHIRAHIDESERGLNGAKYIFLSGYNLETSQYYTTNAGSMDSEYATFQHIEIDNELIDGTGTSSRIFDSGEAHWYYTGVCQY